MRNVVAALLVSLDGVAESPSRWQFDAFDGDLLEEMKEHIAAEDDVLLGRVTYQEWAQYWPNSANEPYASHINNVPKHVVSNTLGGVEWKNSTLVRGSDLAEEVAELKRRPGGNIGVAGSPTLVESLLRADLLDELTLMIHPVLAGSGKRLFKDGQPPKRLKLVRSKTTGKGVSIVTYQPLR